MKSRLFWQFFFKSTARRKGRLIIASASIALAVAVVTGMIAITAGINEKLGSELKAYGANIIVSPRTGDYLDYAVLDTISKLPDVSTADGQLFGNAVIRGRSFEFIGLEIESIKDAGWKLIGDWPEKENEILAGINLKEGLGLEKGDVLDMEHEGRILPGVVSGFIERGGPEDNAVIMGTTGAWELTGLKDKMSAVLVRGRSGGLDDIVVNIESTVPRATARTVRQVAFAERSLLNKIQLLMVLVVIVVLFASGISVTSTMGANVLERREEIGLMKALGATNPGISVFFRAEALLTGLIGGAAGFALGYFFAQAVSKGAFNSYISMPFYLFFISLAMGVILSTAASYFPVRDALKQTPAVILRGE